MPMWQRCLELRVCAWPDNNALLSNRKKLRGSCVPHVARFNDVTADQTCGKLNMWQTRCLNPLPLILKPPPPVECWLFHKQFDPSFHWLLDIHNETFLRSLLASSIYCPLHASFFLSRISRQTYVATRTFPWKICGIRGGLRAAGGPSRFGGLTFNLLAPGLIF